VGVELIGRGVLVNRAYGELAGRTYLSSLVAGSDVEAGEVSGSGDLLRGDVVST
jgi:hypothetical protein